VLRVEAAIRRLTERHQPVSDISHALGFSAPGHFSRFFRQHIGITPTEYRSRVNLFRPDGDPQLRSADALL
jgi:AraC family transcriptional regulator